MWLVTELSGSKQLLARNAHAHIHFKKHTKSQLGYRFKLKQNYSTDMNLTDNRNQEEDRSVSVEKQTFSSNRKQSGLSK